jgi:hypothetical protein
LGVRSNARCRALKAVMAALIIGMQGFGRGCSVENSAIG